MAPISTDQVEDATKDILQNLFSLMIQTYEHRGPRTTAAMHTEVLNLISSLQSLSSLSATLPTQVPPEVITEYVGNGRNPDIYTREFVELVQRRNQALRGKCEAFDGFAGELAGEIARFLPELGGEVGRVRGGGVEVKREVNGEVEVAVKREET
ncbi:MAG: RNA polymerase II mediator complex subunit [Chrysothrix sp. TS-e1954]|nr:MAG: RNA polymerase II mediator complex subunit [Chrysothrix sp. TS-e1954]